MIILAAETTPKKLRSRGRSLEPDTEEIHSCAENQSNLLGQITLTSLPNGVLSLSLSLISSATFLVAEEALRRAEKRKQEVTSFRGMLDCSRILGDPSKCEILPH